MSKTWNYCYSIFTSWDMNINMCQIESQELFEITSSPPCIAFQLVTWSCKSRCPDSILVPK